MIAYLRGDITTKNPAYLIVECNGVGYHVHISLHTYSKVSAWERGKIHTYLHVREDAQVLYGFADESERNLFILLISVQGIGPNTARMMLSSMSVSEMEQAILTENDRLIQSIKGVGPKTAKRLVIELKDKVGKSGVVAENSAFAHNTIREEALSALTMLGFSRVQSEKALGLALKKEPSAADVEQLVKLALKNL